MEKVPRNYVLFFYAAFALFFLMQLLALSKNSPVWWDEAVYISMGKYIFSGGTSGMWEEIRPPAIPIMSGILWKLGFNPLFSGRLLALLFSAGTVALTYLIGKQAFGKKEGILAATMLAFTNVFFYFSTLLLSDIISLFFALAAVHVLISKKSEHWQFASGILLALAFITRFAQATVLAILFFSFAAAETNSKGLSRRISSVMAKTSGLISGFLLLAVPYLLANYYLYNSITKPFTAANRIVTESYTWLYDLGYSYYFREIVVQNIFLLFSILGFAYFFGHKLWKQREKSVVFIAPAVFLAFATFLNHKEARYIIIFLPYLFIVASYGFFELQKRYNGTAHKKLVSVALFIVVAAVFGNLLLKDVDRIKYIEEQPAFEKNMSQIDFGKGPVFSTTPRVGVYSDALIKPIYYSLTYAQNNYEAIHNSTGFVVFNTCDFPCQESDSQCPREIKKLVNSISRNGKIIYYSKDSACEYYFFGKEK